MFYYAKMATILLAASAGVTASAGRSSSSADDRSATALTNHAADHVRVLDPATGTSLLSFRQSVAAQHGLVVLGGRGCAYRYSGRSGCDHIAIAQADKPAVHFWSWGREQPRLRCSLPLRLGPMATTPDGTYLIAGSHSGRLLVWNSLTGELVQAFDAHLKAVRCIRLVKDGSHVITGGDDSDVFVWNLADLLDGATNVSLSARGAARQKRKRRRTTDESSSSSIAHTTAYVDPVCTWNAHTLAVTDIHCGWGSSRGSVITCSLDQTCKFWDLAQKIMLHSVAFPTFLRCITCDLEQRFLYAGGGDGVVYALNLRAVAETKARSTAASFRVESGQQFSSFGGGAVGMHKKSGVSSSSMSSSSSASPAEGKNSQIMMEGHTGPVNCLSVDRGGALLFSGSDDGTIIGWDTLSRQQLYQIDQAGPVTNLLIMPRPRDILRNKASSSGVDSSGLRPLPPLHKKMMRAEDSSGSCLGFLSTSAGVEWQKPLLASGEGGAVARAASMAEAGLSLVGKNKSSVSSKIIPAAMSDKRNQSSDGKGDGNVVSEAEKSGGDGFVELNAHSEKDAASSSSELDTSSMAAASLVARIEELEAENMRWQALATKLRSMVPAAGGVKRKR